MRDTITNYPRDILNGGQIIAKGFSGENFVYDTVIIGLSAGGGAMVGTSLAIFLEALSGLSNHSFPVSPLSEILMGTGALLAATVHPANLGRSSRKNR